MRNNQIRMNLGETKAQKTNLLKIVFQELTDNEWLVIITPFSDSILSHIYEEILIRIM